MPLGIGVTACGSSNDSGHTTVPATTRSTTPGTTPGTTPDSTPTTDTVVHLFAGRPLRRRNGRARWARARRGSSRLTDQAALQLEAPVRTALADHWRRQGELEHASIVAFHDLAARLEAVHAPGALVAAAQRAAHQETDHAQRCLELAGRYEGLSYTPGRLQRPLRLPRTRASELSALAVEALRDGVVNEGYAAWVAEQQAARATDRRVQATLDVIARDEADHAELSAEVLAWCRREGGATVEHALDAAVAALPARIVAVDVPSGLDTVLLAAHGLSDPDPDGAGFAHVVADALASAGRSPLPHFAAHTA